MSKKFNAKNSLMSSKFQNMFFSREAYNGNISFDAAHLTLEDRIKMKPIIIM
jgi:hypothetical protein